MSERVWESRLEIARDATGTALQEHGNGAAAFDLVRHDMAPPAVQQTRRMSGSQRRHSSLPLDEIPLVVIRQVAQRICEVFGAREDHLVRVALLETTVVIHSTGKLWLTLPAPTIDRPTFNWGFSV